MRWASGCGGGSGCSGCGGCGGRSGCGGHIQYLQLPAVHSAFPSVMKCVCIGMCVFMHVCTSVRACVCVYVHVSLLCPSTSCL